MDGVDVSDDHVVAFVALVIVGCCVATIMDVLLLAVLPVNS